MSENATRDRSWRVDSKKSSAEHDSPSSIGLPKQTDDAGHLAQRSSPPVYESFTRTIKDLRLWGRRFRGLIPSRDETSDSIESSVEAIVHDFAETLAAATDPSIVIAELVDAAKKLTGARRVELVFETATEASTDTGRTMKSANPSSDQLESDTPLIVSVEYGAQHWGALRLVGLPGKRWNRERVEPPIRPLKTLCTLAAMALDGISTKQLFDTLGSEVFEEPATADEASPTNQATALLHDATYLHVILPYALGQAHRHREPVSILHAGIDRLSAIHEMLGPEMVTEAVNRVGEILLKRLRSSDVVSRMEDDRILVMLPNATASDTCRIANEIRAMVEEGCASLAELPPLTVSVGVASFPTHAKDVFTLLNSADESMSNAQHSGRNRVVVAEVPDQG